MSTTAKPAKKPLSKRELEALAQGVVLGRELLAEMERLEKKGVALYNSDTYKGISAHRVRLFLSGQEQPTPAEQAEGIDTASKRREALEQVKRDRDYLKVSLDDFHHWRRPSEYGGEHLYVDRWDGNLIYALAHHLGYRSNPNVNGADGVYYIEEGKEWAGNRREYYLLAHDFEERLAKRSPSWLDLLRSKERQIREAATQYLGDIANPAEVIMTLVDRRIGKLCGEFDFAVNARRQERERRAADAAKRAKERQVDDAWEGFFEGEEHVGTVALSDVNETAPEAPAPAHPRGVAPELGDSGLGR